MLIEAQLFSGLFRHHALVPSRLEHQVHIGLLHTLNTLYLGANILQYEVGSRTGGGCEGHIHIHRTIVFDIYLIYHTEVVDVYGDFRIIDCLQNIYDTFF